jgi:glycerophosphoryl diester phosphodiesterase
LPQTALLRTETEIAFLTVFVHESAMTAINFLKEALLHTVDLSMAFVPRAQPPRERLQNFRIVAHRGSRERGATENTLDAFEHALEAGAWGIEFDVRWTKDDEPVIHHDKDCRRTFQSPLVLEDVTLETLRKHLPLIPTLGEAVQSFKGRTRMFIELKGVSDGWSQKRWQRLESELSNVSPAHDFHIMSIKRELLLACEFVPKHARLPVAEINISEMSRLALEEKMAGVTGQYVMLTDRIIQRHHDAGQLVGTGFASSKSVLYRELNRGVDWIFTNHVTRLIQIRDEASGLAD